MEAEKEQDEEEEFQTGRSLFYEDMNIDFVDVHELFDDKYDESYYVNMFSSYDNYNTFD